MDTPFHMKILIKQLLPFLYPNFTSDPVNVIEDSSASCDCIPKELLENLKTVLSKKKKLILQRWGKYFAISCLKALSSHEMYLRYVMFACEFEIGLSDDVFDSGLNVCALVVTFITETFENTGVNFRDLTVDILMIFYEANLAEPFHWFGGFKVFAEYLRAKCLAEESNFNDDFQVPVTYTDSLEKNKYNNKVNKIYEKTRIQPEYITHENVIRNNKYRILASALLFTTKSKLPTLPSSAELMARIRANRQRRAADSKNKTTETETKRKTMQTNSKREEVLLTANITLATVPNVTGGDSKSQSTSSDSKRQSMSSDSKRKPSASDSKREPAERDSKRQSTSNDSKRQSISSDSKRQSTSSDSKRQSTSSDWKREFTGKDSKRESAERDPKRELAASDSKRESPDRDSKRESPDRDSKRESPDRDSKRESPDRDSKRKLAASDSKRKLAASDSKRQFVASDAKRDPVANDSKRQSTSSDSRRVPAASDSRREPAASDSKLEPAARSQACDMVEHNTDISWCENIVRQVIEYNNSHCSYLTEKNKLILEETRVTLEIMSDTIQSLIEILDVYDEG